MPPGGGYPPGGGSHPPGGGAGWGPPPGGGGGWGPPGGTPPPGGPGSPQQAAPKKKTGLYLGLGCGCVVILGCIIAAVAFPSLIDMLGPGEEVASIPATIGQPFTLEYVQEGSQKYQAWLEVEVDYTAGYNLSGPILLSENGAAFGQYTLAETGEGSPVQERSGSRRVQWTSSSLNGSGRAEGNVSLFPIPARPDGHRVTISGTIHATPGTTGTLRFFVAKRD
jgi:hypothetical protein